jgi:hypothetical protein
MVKPTQPIWSISTYHSVDSYALAKFIADYYDLGNFDATLESSNDTTHDITVSGNLDKWEEDDLKEILEMKGCEYYKLGVVLNDLCRKDVIPAGEWLVRVCW